MALGGANALPLTPKYEAIKRALLDRINGEWEVGAQIPSEHELAREYEVSRVTVQRALHELVRAGVVNRVKGAGTFVTRQKVRSAFVRLDDLSEFERSTKGTREILLRRKWQSQRRVIGEPLGKGIRMQFLLARWRRHNVIASSEQWLVDTTVAEIEDGRNSSTSVVDWLHEHQPVDRIDEQCSVIRPPKRLRRYLEIADAEPRASFRRRFYSRGRWVATVRETYADAALTIRRRYSTLPGLPLAEADSGDSGPTGSR